MLLLRKIALPIALLYGLVVRLRNLCYDIGIFPSKSFRTPTICVGNLSVGGTGKTPMIEFLVEEYHSQGRLAVLSRGYRRKTKGFVLATKKATAETIGDEPLQLHRKYPELTVAVDANRQRGIIMLQDSVAPGLILLDDAFQHRKVCPSLALLLTPYGDLYTDDFYLPAGNLRDSRREARRADLIIVTKCPPELSQEARDNITRKLKPDLHQQVLFASLEYDPFLKGGEKQLALSDLRDQPFLLVTGIARPEPLLAHLKATSLSFEHLRYRDHHFFSEEEKTAFRRSPLVLTTEKDYVRMGMHSGNVYYIGVRHRFLGNGRECMEERLKAL